MKSIFILVALVVLTMGSAFAGPRTSSLIIRANHNETISVAIGEMPFSAEASEVTIRNLKKGKHYVRIIKHTRGVFRSKSEIAFEGFVTIGRKREIIAIVDSNGSLVIQQDEKRPKNSPYYETDRKDRGKEVKISLQLPKMLSVF